MAGEPPSLRRALGFGALLAYGVGDILGAGIYALVGKIAGVAAGAAWLAFAVALGVAALSALSYAELGRRFPTSAGEAHYCGEAFRRPGIALWVGWLVLCSGVVSMATVSRAIAGYVRVFLPAAWDPILITAFLVGLTAVNFYGIRASSRANLVCLAVELSGLLLVIGAGAILLARVGPVSAAAPVEPVPWTAILQGGALAFFAFIGFEDMVNVAEEVQAPQRMLPAAILGAVAIAGLLYILVAALAVAVVPVPTLAGSSAPLVEVVRVAAPAVPAALFSLVALFAVANTALANFVMGSRLLYGMARQGLIPAWLGAVHAVRRTPHRAAFVIFLAALLLALSGTVTALAGATSALILTVFAAVNLSLAVLKRRCSMGQTGFTPPRRGAGFTVPAIVPVLGAVSSLGLLCFVPPRAMAAAAFLAVCGAGLVWLRRGCHRRPQ